MAKLTFYAKGSGLVTRPDFNPVVGQAPRYVGRLYHAPTRELRATREGFAVDENSPVARRLIKVTARDRSLWPADEHTALRCMVQFVPLEFVEGEWIAAKQNAAKPLTHFNGD